MEGLDRELNRLWRRVDMQLHSLNKEHNVDQFLKFGLGLVCSFLSRVPSEDMREDLINIALDVIEKTEQAVEGDRCPVCGKNHKQEKEEIRHILHGIVKQLQKGDITFEDFPRAVREELKKIGIYADVKGLQIGKTKDKKIIKYAEADKDEED